MANICNYRCINDVVKSLYDKENTVENDEMTEDEADVEEHQETSSEDDVSQLEINNKHKSTEETDEITKKKRKLNSPTFLNVFVKQEQNNEQFFGKDGHFWSSKPPDIKNERPPDESSFISGPIGAASGALTPLEIWSLLVTDEMLTLVEYHTNQEIHRVKMSSGENVTYQNYVTLTELKAFIGLLYLSGLQKTNFTNLEELWSVEFGPILFRVTMPCKRFAFLLSVIRFDDKNNRQARRQNDNFAQIRELYSQFITNCTAYYQPGEHCTIDEHMLTFKGQCLFKIQSKKTKQQGIKIVMMNDSRTFYMISAEPYLKKCDSESSIPFYFVRKLSSSIIGSNRNIVCDKWLTSVSLVSTMKNEFSLRMTGPVTKAQPEIPEIFYQIPESQVVVDNTMSLIKYYKEKEDKIEILVSSFNRESGSDSIVSMYGEIKGSTESFNQLCRQYTVTRKTCRWSTRVFYGILDQAGMNALILYNSNNLNPKMVRTAFLKNFIMALVTPWMRQRLSLPTLRRDLRVNIENILFVETPPKSAVPGMKRRCALCPRSKDRKTMISCLTCQIPICEMHRNILCFSCSAKD